MAGARAGRVLNRRPAATARSAPRSPRATIPPRRAPCARAAAGGGGTPRPAHSPAAIFEAGSCTATSHGALIFARGKGGPGGTLRTQAKPWGRPGHPAGEAGGLGVAPSPPQLEVPQPGRARAQLCSHRPPPHIGALGSPQSVTLTRCHWSSP